ncbi:hypothetical protein P3T36_004534 [Kitasatospora sp. MAP12-15]|uniref:hypothetical protein n=1 Tax=unclassified Kitasatospora TaxID=2633591 RepID=UPI0024760FC1|nr:hypothetical protein [Kitasatospora sp. MAP12-44]MDH6111380.1 hypothetical protein [Kitasatospora sp. MAP12-44]
MRVHRSEHPCHFTVLPNGILQDRRLSYTARGLLADLLSRQDGWREDGRHMADSSPQGRGAIRKALKELTEAGYYRVDKVRMADGTMRSEAHVFDVSQLAIPGVPRPGSGQATPAPADTLPVKELEKEPSLPSSSQGQVPRGGTETETEGKEGGQETPLATPIAADAQTREAVALLFRVIRPEPRLRLGAVEAFELAPLVAQWLERGSSQADLAGALLPGLPAQMYSAAGVLRDRLTRKMPPAPEPVKLAAPQLECAKCHDPVSQPGICRACAGLGTPMVQVGGGAAATPRGMALVRAALRSAKGDTLPNAA